MAFEAIPLQVDEWAGVNKLSSQSQMCVEFGSSGEHINRPNWLYLLMFFCPFTRMSVATALPLVVN
jgi:hypothetical protein